VRIDWSLVEIENVHFEVLGRHPLM